MVHNAMIASSQARAVHRFFSEVPYAEANIADDHVVAPVSPRRKIGQANAIARSGLAGDGAVRLVHRARPFEPYQAGHAEDNRPRTFRHVRLVRTGHSLRRWERPASGFGSAKPRLSRV